MTTQPLTQSATVPNSEMVPAKHEKRQANSLLPWAFMIMFIGVVIGIIGKMLVHDEIVTVIGALISVAGMFLTAYSSIALSRRPRHDASTSSPPKLPTQPAQYLPEGKSLGYVDSVTERTTDLLKVRRGKSE